MHDTINLEVEEVPIVTREELSEMFEEWRAANARDNSIGSAQDWANEYNLRVLTAQMEARRVLTKH